MQGTLISTSLSQSTPEKATGYLWRIAVAAALGGLLFGYDWVVIGGARQFYELYFHLSSASLVGWANSSALLGCLIGSISAGYLAERLGRRRILLIAGLLFAVSSVFTGWSFSFLSFITWRIAGGVAIGLASNVSPLYIAEISPAAVRGRLVSLNQFAIVVGILLAQIVNWLIARPVPQSISSHAMLESWNVLYGWRWMFTVLVVPSIVFLIASLTVPESPRWLLAHERDEEARTVLTSIAGPAYAEREMHSIQHALLVESQAESRDWKELLAPGVRRVLLIAMALAVLQQWTGINVLFNYAADVYRSAGYAANDIFLNIVITGAINLLCTVLSMFLVDRLGRRPLMLFGCLGIALSHFLCALAYRGAWRGSVVLVLTLSAIGCYAITLAPVTWVLIAEIFPNRVRSQGVSAAVSALWIASFSLTYTFPILNRDLGTGRVFFGYGVVCALGFAMVAAFVPETKGLSLEQIEAGVLNS